MYDLSENCEKLIESAEKEAKRLNHRYVDIDNIIGAIVSDEFNIPYKIMKNFGLDQEIIKIFVNTEKEKVPSFAPLFWSQSLEKILKLAMKEAIEYEIENVEIEHLFIGILRDKTNPYSQLFSSKGFSLDDVRNEIKEMQSEENM